MVRTNRGIGRQLSIAGRLAGLGLTSIALAACVNSATLSPQPSTSLSPATAGVATAAAASAQPTPTPSVSAAGPTHIEWHVQQLTGLPAHPDSTTNPDGSGIYSDFQISGWSRGYVAFRSVSLLGKDSDTLSKQIYPSSSSDGTHWTEGAPLDLKGLDKDEMIGFVYDGPAGLLAVGHAPAATCGGPTPIDGMWLSGDGSSWQRVTAPKFYSMAAGPAGYVATDLQTQVWTSTDALKWHQVDMTKAAVKGITVQDAASFSGGFVVAAAAPVPNSEGCGGPDQKTPSLWWSGDGGTWSRDQLSNAPVAADSWSSVDRITDHALLAIGSTYDEKAQESKYQAWTSTDGKTWAAYNDARVGNGRVLTDGKTGMLISAPDDKNLIKVYLFGPDLALAELPQTGALPTDALADAGEVVLGPNGLLIASSDGSRLWLGTPTR